MTTTHTCHARGCTVPVKPELLMCLAHWRRVPRVLQLKVWAEYRPGQCNLNPMPSAAWHRAADAAIAAVFEKEKAEHAAGI